MFHLKTKISGKLSFFFNNFVNLDTDLKMLNKINDFKIKIAKTSSYKIAATDWNVKLNSHILYLKQFFKGEFEFHSFLNFFCFISFDFLLGLTYPFLHLPKSMRSNQTDFSIFIDGGREIHSTRVLKTANVAASKSWKEFNKRKGQEWKPNLVYVKMKKINK